MHVLVSLVALCAGLRDGCGVQLIMIRRMMRDMLSFVALLVIFIAGYGVAIQTILFPSREFDDIAVASVLYRCAWSRGRRACSVS